MDYYQEEPIKYSVLANGKSYKKDSREWLHKSSSRKLSLNLRQTKNSHRTAEMLIPNHFHFETCNTEPEYVTRSSDDKAIRSFSFSRAAGSDSLLNPDAIKMTNSCAAMIFLPHTPTNAELKQCRKRRNISSAISTRRAPKTEKVLFVDENANFMGEFDNIERLSNSLGFQPIKEGSMSDSLPDDLTPPPSDLVISPSFWGQVMSTEPSTDSTTWWRENKDVVASDSSSSTNYDAGFSPPTSPVPNKRHRFQSLTKKYTRRSVSTQELYIQEIENDAYPDLDLSLPPRVFNYNNQLDKLQNTPSPWQEIFGNDDEKECK